MNAAAFLSRLSDPWRNLAFEEWLFRRPSGLLPPHVLYLWRNSPCVVVGRNQNPWKECNLPLMRAKNIPLIRRRSGGGTVVHNLGNTNYTCFMPRDAFNRDASAQLVADALHELDIPAAVSPRHDIVINGMKVSGSAFKVVHERAYAHGTMLIGSDLKELGMLLKSSRKGAIEGKGVESVPSKTTRLEDHSFTVTHTDFCRAVAEEYGIVFNGKPGLKNQMIELTMKDFDSDPKMKEYYDEIRTNEWTYGQTPSFTHTMDNLFPWGRLEVVMTITEGVITGTETSLSPLNHPKGDGISQSSLHNAIRAFFVNLPYDDGTIATWNLLNDEQRWKMCFSSGDDLNSACDVFEWLKGEVWSGCYESSK